MKTQMYNKKQDVKNKSEISNFRDLKIWQMGKSIASDIYRLTNDFPQKEIYGLTSQMRRAAISLPCNIAEGYSRKSGRDYLKFLGMASGACGELETQLELSCDLGFSEANKVENILERINHETRMIRSLMKSLYQKNQERKAENQNGYTGKRASDIR